MCTSCFNGCNCVNCEQWRQARLRQGECVRQDRTVAYIPFTGSQSSSCNCTCPCNGSKKSPV